MKKLLFTIVVLFLIAFWPGLLPDHIEFMAIAWNLLYLMVDYIFQIQLAPYIREYKNWRCHII